MQYNRPHFWYACDQNINVCRQERFLKPIWCAEFKADDNCAPIYPTCEPPPPPSCDNVLAAAATVRNECPPYPCLPEQANLCECPFQEQCCCTYTCPGSVPTAPCYEIADQPCYTCPPPQQPAAADGCCPDWWCKVPTVASYQSHPSADQILRCCVPPNPNEFCQIYQPPVVPSSSTVQILCPSKTETRCKFQPRAAAYRQRRHQQQQQHCWSGQRICRTPASASCDDICRTYQPSPKDAVVCCPPNVQIRCHVPSSTYPGQILRQEMVVPSAAARPPDCNVCKTIFPPCREYKQKCCKVVEQPTLTCQCWRTKCLPETVGFWKTCE